jgi:hypothetical protein
MNTAASRPHGQSRNAAYFERVRRFETNPRGWYPAPGYYLRSIRHANAVTAAGGRIHLDWTDSDGHDAEAWQREQRAALHRRISAKGGIAYSRHNDPSQRGIDPIFTRDQIALRNIRTIRLRVYQFESRAVRKRFAHRARAHYEAETNPAGSL